MGNLTILCWVSFKPITNLMFLRIESNRTNADTRRGEILLGFYVRAGHWIDAIEVLTSLGRKSGVFGSATGGSGYVILLNSEATIFLTSLDIT